jgi:hypothetical protein
MLEDLLKKAIDVGADRIEIEHTHGDELVTALRGPVGVGIARLDGEQRDRVFNEMREMERRKTTTFGDTVYRLAFSKYESFGDWVYVMELKIDKKASPSHQRSGAKSRASR